MTERSGFLRVLCTRGLMTLVAAMLVAGGLELLARWLHEPQPLRRVWDPFAYRIPHPGLVDTFVSPWGETVTVRWNELGMRGPSLSQEVAPGTLTLVFVGGSTTENYAHDLPSTFPELVGRRLESRLRRPVRVLNAGMSAASTATSLARLQHQVLPLEPSMVVVLHAVNDLVGGFHARYRADGRHLPRPPDVDWRPRSYLLDWARSARLPGSGRLGVNSPSRLADRRPTARDEELHDVDYSTFPALAAFERNLRSMAAIAAAHEVPILFLTQPTMYRFGLERGEVDRFFMVESLLSLGMVPPDVESLARGMERFNGVILDLPAGGEGVWIFDLAAEMPRDWGLMYDDCHFTRAGNVAVADLLTPVVGAVLDDERPGGDG